jgi:uncharacterized pyridoxamine 5'-phosphate oxidase family protein
MGMKQPNIDGKVHDFLKKHHMAVLSTVSLDGKPWGSAVNFVIDEELNFFFMTRGGTLKYKNIENNPNVAITVADEESQQTVQAQGEISKVAVKDIIDVVFKKLAKIKPHNDYGWIPPVIKVHKGDYMVLMFTPSKLQYADFKQHKTEVFDEYIEQII